MRTRTKALVVALVALLPLTMAPSGGLPSNPRFRSIGVGQQAPGANGNLSALGSISAQNMTAIGALAAGSASFDTLTINPGGTLNLTESGVAAVALPAASTMGGSAIATQESGTQAMTQTGCSGTPTAPNVRWVRSGNIVTLNLPTVACTSNATSWSWSALPASIRPPNGWTGAALGCIIDNGVQTCGNGAVSITSTGIVDFMRNASVTGWTAAGAKNVGHFTSVTYGVS